MSAFICPKSLRTYDLPPHLITHQRKVAGRWRYKGPQGLKTLTKYINKDLSYIDVEDAIAYALKLNKKHYGIKPDTSLREPVKDVAAFTPLMQAAEDYIESYEDLNPTKSLNKTWSNYRGYIRKFSYDFSGKGIDIDSLEAWFYGRDSFSHYNHTYHTQKYHRASIGPYIDYLFRKDLVPGLKINPLMKGSIGYFKSSEKPVKLRTPLYKEEFDIILQAAIDDGNDLFVLAMKLELATSVRIDHLVNLRFDEWDQETNIVRTMVPKSKAQRGEDKASVLKWDLNADINKDILNYYKQAWSTRNSVVRDDGVNTTPAQHVLHTKYKRIVKHKCRKHYAQLVARDLQDCFLVYRESVPRIAALPLENKPSFHDIRALFALVKWEEGWSQEMISKVLGHADLKVVFNYYGIQVDDWRTTSIDDSFVKEAAG